MQVKATLCTKELSMSKEKLILDIRYIENDIENISGNSTPSYTGEIFSLPDEIDPFSSRVARKLGSVQKPVSFHYHTE